MMSTAFPPAYRCEMKVVTSDRGTKIGVRDEHTELSTGSEGLLS